MLKIYDVFISYSRTDGGEYAHVISRELLSRGWSVYLDQGLLTGETSPRRTLEAIEHSRVVVIVLSPAASVSQWVQDEVALALRRNQRVIPIILDRAALNSPVGSLVADRVSIIAEGRNPQEIGRELEQAIADVVQIRPSRMIGEMPNRLPRRRMLVDILFLALAASLVYSLAHYFYDETPRDTIDILVSELREKGGNPGGNLEEVVLARADLKGLDLSGANMRRAVLVEADLSRAKLQEANLMDSLLAYGRMGGVIASRADFSRAKMIAVDLSGADLHGAILRRTDLRLADLRNADLRAADLRGAVLEGAILEGTMFKAAKINRETVLPRHLDYRAAGMIYLMAN